MALFERIGRVIRANTNDYEQKNTDPTELVNQAMAAMQANVIGLRQAVASAIAAQNQTERRVSQNQAEIALWKNRAQLVLDRGDENLAREALLKKRRYVADDKMLRAQVIEQAEHVDRLKKQWEHVIRWREN
jgi:phage shock protein A